VCEKGGKMSSLPPPEEVRFSLILSLQKPNNFVKIQWVRFRSTISHHILTSFLSKFLFKTRNLFDLSLCSYSFYIISNLVFCQLICIYFKNLGFYLKRGWKGIHNNLCHSVFSLFKELKMKRKLHVFKSFLFSFFPARESQ
jgi:hypothetical protein